MSKTLIRTEKDGLVNLENVEGVTITEVQGVEDKKGYQVVLFGSGLPNLFHSAKVSEKDTLSVARQPYYMGQMFESIEQASQYLSSYLSSNFFQVSETRYVNIDKVEYVNIQMNAQEGQELVDTGYVALFVTTGIDRLLSFYNEEKKSDVEEDVKEKEPDYEHRLLKRVIQSDVYDTEEEVENWLSDIFTISQKTEAPILNIIH